MIDDWEQVGKKEESGFENWITAERGNQFGAIKSGARQLWSRANLRGWQQWQNKHR